MRIERYPQSVRRFHTAIYVVTLLLLATGWWLLAGREGQPSPIASLTGIPDARLHIWLGRALVIVALAPLAFALRAIRAFVRETARFDRGDVGWLVRLPVAAFGGRLSLDTARRLWPGWTERHTAESGSGEAVRSARNSRRAPADDQLRGERQAAD